MPIPWDAIDSDVASGGGGGMSFSGWGDILKVGGDIFGGIGSFMQGSEMNDAYKYNAQVLNEQAQLVEAAGALKVEEIGVAEDEMLGTQKAVYARAGVTMSGSPTDVALQTATNFEYDKLVTKYNTEVAASKMKSEAGLQTYYGRMSKQKGEFAFGQSLIKGAMDVLPLIGMAA
jgi:hypothetical protein